MIILKTLLFGFLQGMFQFVPISSSGQLSVIADICKTEELPGILPMLVLLNLAGTLTACLVFSRELSGIMRELKTVPAFFKVNAGSWLKGSGSSFKRGYTSNYGRLTLLFTVGNLPILLAGIFLPSVCEDACHSYIFTGMGFLITALFLFVAVITGTGSNAPRDLAFWKIVLIGLVRVICLLPGISALAVTYALLILFEEDRKTAFNMSVIMTIPVSIGAAIRCLPLYFSGGFSFVQLAAYVLGFVFCFMTSLVAARSTLRFARRSGILFFAVYSLILGFFTFVCYFAASV